jgi:hypothetical protein
MLLTIAVVLLILWLLGAFVPVNAGRPYYTPVSWGGGGVGAVIVILLILALLHVI